MRTIDIVNELKNNIKDFCYGMYGDTMRENEILNSELKGLGIINGDDEMVWKSPDQSLIFEVSRDYSHSKTGIEAGYQYICTINVKNNIGIPITKILFTELDAIRILSGFVDFATPSYYVQDNVIYIDINPNNTYLEKHTIVLQNIKIENMDNVLFQINKYNPYQQMIANVVTIPMTHEQLNDLAFHLFFALLIDIEIPEELDEEMFRIEDYITTENYYTFQKRRMELQEIQVKNPDKARYAQSLINDNEYLINQRFVMDVPMNTVIPQQGMNKIIEPITGNCQYKSHIVNKGITVRR